MDSKTARKCKWSEKQSGRTPWRAATEWGTGGSNGCKPFVPVMEEQKKSPIER